ncbi:MAG: Nif11-like leader peptide family natural product precursor [Syntrophomonadales bacterium]|jgi:predicted ribosomally synthesized peptide with nif11-like leader
MSKEDVTKFLDLMRENKDLGVRLAQALDSGDIEALARESGLEFTEAELREQLAATESNTIKLSDGELAAATGGHQRHFYVFCITCNKRLHDGLVTPVGAANITGRHLRDFPDHWTDTRNDLGL